MKEPFIAFFFIAAGVFACLNTCLAQTVATPQSDPFNKFREPEMVFVEGSTFTMAQIKDEAGEGYSVSTSSHVVTLNSYYIGKYEITQAEWQAVMGDSLNFSQHAGCANCPVEEVSWNDIQTFVQKLNERTGRYYQLPTQAQWEFAARGGRKSRGYKYAGSNNIDYVALLGSAFTGHTQPVGSKHPNELGIYDMTGNVAEWCRDVFNSGFSRPRHQGYSTQSLPGYGYHIRGGSWDVHPEQCQLAKDGSMGYANDRSAKVGFRLVLIPDIPLEKCFQGDTIKYTTCIFNRRSNYIDRPFYMLLNDLELPLQSFFNGSHNSAADTGEVTTFAFYDAQTTNNILSDLRAHRVRQDIDNIVFITIKWKKPLPKNIVEDLYKTSGGKFTPAVQAYFRQQIIMDITTKRFAYVG